MVNSLKDIFKSIPWTTNLIANVFRTFKVLGKITKLKLKL